MPFFIKIITIFLAHNKILNYNNGGEFMSSLTTKKAIFYALKDLLKTRPFNKITINDIAKHCNINRQTFYYHFLDKEDLVEWICKEEMKTILDNQDNNATWQDKFLSVFILMQKEQGFISNLYHSVSIEILRTSLYRLVYPIIYEEIKNIAASENMAEEEKAFITDFYKYAFVAIVLDWVKNDMQENPKVIVAKVSNLVTGTIKHACLSLKL